MYSKNLGNNELEFTPTFETQLLLMNEYKLLSKE